MTAGIVKEEGVSLMPVSFDSNSAIDFLGFDVAPHHFQRPIKVLSLFDGISTGRCFCGLV